MARTGCCRKQYTTRKYDYLGGVAWTQDYFRGIPVTFATLTNVFAATTVALPANTYANGSSGVGATITMNSVGSFTIDGQSTIVGQRYLIKNESTAANNGIYTCTTAGSGGAAAKFTRATDFDTSAEMIANIAVKVINGTTNANREYALASSTPITVGTDAVTWSQVIPYGGKKVLCQAIDSSRVYVGGNRVTKSDGTAWSVVGINKTTGTLEWAYDLGADCRRIQIDDSGNVVCMHDLVAQNAAAPGTKLNQVFTRLQPNGTYIDQVSFLQNYSVVNPTTNVVYGVDFAINESGDYHILCTCPANTATTFRAYEWAAPLSSAPTLIETASFWNPRSLYRINGRDVFGGFLTGPPTALTWRQNSMYIGKSQLALPKVQSDFDFLLPLEFYDNSKHALTSASITAAGTTAGTATLMVVGKDYTTISGTANQGLILPTGSAGDVIGIDRLNSIGTLVPNIKIYPPSGGTLNQSTASVLAATGFFYLCTSAGNWINGTGVYALFGTTQPLIDSAGDYRAVPGGVYKITTNGGIPWGNGTIQNGDIDATDRCYGIGSTSSSSTVSSFSADGKRRWGHRHIITGFMQNDSSDDHVIGSGYDSTTGNFGPMLLANDSYFRADDNSVVSFGRTAKNSQSGVGGNYTVGFTLRGASGVAAASGTILLAVLADNANTAGSLAISGGGTWTKLTGGTTGYSSCSVWMRVCGVSEPLSYTVTYSGSTATDSACCTLIEVFGANVSNPDDIQVATNTGTSPTATSSNADDGGLICVADLNGNSMSFDDTPTGYDLWSRVQTSVGNTLTAAIATRGQVGSGSISPGAWVNPATSASYLWTILFKT